MLKIPLATFILVLGFLLFIPNQAQAQDDKTMAETVVHLLSYVSMDYPGAVENGEVIDQPEYEEQIEFASEAYKLTQESEFVKDADKEALLKQIEELNHLVNHKASAAEISQLATKINNTIIKETGLETAPKIWPNLINGQKLYTQNCAICHGTNGEGDGPGGQALDPLPSNFHEADLMDNFSPYQAYNSIRLGVPRTGMQAFTELNEVELWDLAFYIKSIRFDASHQDSIQLQKKFNQLTQKIDLTKVANLTDLELADTLQNFTSDAQVALLALRTQYPDNLAALNSLPTAREGLQKTLESYQNGEIKLARTQAISAYLEGIEPVEARLKTINSDFVADIENQMFKVRQAIEKKRDASELKVEIDKALVLIDQADDMLKGQKLNYWLTFFNCSFYLFKRSY